MVSDPNLALLTTSRLFSLMTSAFHPCSLATVENKARNRRQWQYFCIPCAPGFS